MIKLAINSYMPSSGKDTCADYLCENHGFTKYSFSYGIYEIAHKYYGVPEEQRPKREMLHHIGESLRKIDPLLWINYTLNKIEKEGKDRILITDVRKLMEHAYLKELGWTHFMVYCDPSTAIGRAVERDGNDNVDENLMLDSELENQLRPLKNTMIVVDNNNSLDNTFCQLDRIVKDEILKEELSIIKKY